MKDIDHTLKPDRVNSPIGVTIVVLNYLQDTRPLNALWPVRGFDDGCLPPI
jgi:hypothetical protein